MCTVCNRHSSCRQHICLPFPLTLASRIVLLCLIFVYLTGRPRNVRAVAEVVGICSVAAAYVDNFNNCQQFRWAALRCILTRRVLKHLDANLRHLVSCSRGSQTEPLFSFFSLLPGAFVQEALSVYFIESDLTVRESECDLVVELFCLGVSEGPTAFTSIKHQATTYFCAALQQGTHG